MNLYDCDKYLEDIRYIAHLDMPWNKLHNSCIMITGATGMIGSFLVDVLLEKNKTDHLNCKIIAVSRSKEKALSRFGKQFYRHDFLYLPHDVRQPLGTINSDKIDFIMFFSSNTHPVSYATDPIGNITTNILGLQNMLDYASRHKIKRFVFASSNEIYGENRGDVELFDENYCGYINSNTLRAGYPESKRCCEALCQAYISQEDIDVVIARFTRTYGPTMQMTDTKAISQFIIKGINNDDIILKSQGNQLYSYQYVADSVSGLLRILLQGQSGEAYNIADEKSDITLKELAGYIAGMNGKKVIFEQPDQIERNGYSTATKARLNGNKLKGLGWEPKYNVYNGIERTIHILKEIR